MPRIEEVFSPDGILARRLEDFEYRPEQAEMAESVAGALSVGSHLVVEAGTGTGKTLAYLVPAILSGLQVVVSTGTKNLQEQIWFRDIPMLKKLLGQDFPAVMLKGRSNYLCSLRLKKFAQMSFAKNALESRHLDMIHEWAQTTKTGDRAELAGLPEDSPVWNQVCSSADFCSSQKCPRLTDCSVSRLRREAEQALIVLVNHHLFFADLALREKGVGTVLPDYQVAIFDEAHEVEEIASQYFGFSVSNFRIEELVRDTMRELEDTKPRNRADLLSLLDRLDTRSKNFFGRLRRSEGEDRRFSLRESPPDREAGKLLGDSLLALESGIEAADQLSEGLRTVGRRFFGIREELESLIVADREEFIFWGETRGSGVFLNASSLDVAPLMKSTLYGSCTAVFTSATLAAGGDFSFFQRGLGLEGAKTLALQSPFDFGKQAVVYLPPLPEPNSSRFLEALSEEAVRLINLVKGRTLFLFTSFRAMYEVRRRIEGRIPYTIFMQGEGPRHVLLESFRNEVDSILLATSSFWQGVDVKGESLSCVIIDRLPFSSPGDPITAARIERIRAKGGSPFKDYQLPEAVLALRQGLGRLIRHRNDRGIMMVADSRIRSKGYGKTFLSSLPPAPIVDSFEKLVWP